MSQFDQIKTFNTLAETLSVSKTADRLNTVPSVISRRLKQLEQSLGIQLIHRNTRSLHLSSEGEVFYARSRQIMDDLDEMLNEVQNNSEAYHGQLRIASPLSFGLPHLAPLIFEYMHDNPNLKVDIDMSDRQVDLVAEGFDVAIRIGQLSDSSLKARRLSSIRHIVCAAPEFWARNGKPKAPKDLESLPIIAYSNLDTPGVWQFSTTNGESGKIRGKVILQGTDGDFIKQAAITGLGAICEPSFIVHQAVRNGDLEPVLLDHHWFGMSLYIVYPHTRSLSPRVRNFIDFLVSRFSDPPAWEQIFE